MPNVSPVPTHLHTVTPRLVVPDGAAAIDFYARAFGARELGERFADPAGRVIHAEIQIGDSVVMITEEADPEAPARSPVSLGGFVSAIMATYWSDVDSALGPGRRGWWRCRLPAGGPVLWGAGRTTAGSIWPPVDAEPTHRGRLARRDEPSGSEAVRLVATPVLRQASQGRSSSPANSPASRQLASSRK